MPSSFAEALSLPLTGGNGLLVGLQAGVYRLMPRGYEIIGIFKKHPFSLYTVMPQFIEVPGVTHIVGDETHKPLNTFASK